MIHEWWVEDGNFVPEINGHENPPPPCRDFPEPTVKTPTHCLPLEEMTRMRLQV